MKNKLVLQTVYVPTKNTSSDFALAKLGRHKVSENVLLNLRLEKKENHLVIELDYFKHIIKDSIVNLVYNGVSPDDLQKVCDTYIDNLLNDIK